MKKMINEYFEVDEAELENERRAFWKICDHNYGLCYKEIRRKP